MSLQYKYMAKNLITGEIVEKDKAEDLGNAIGCVKSTIHKYCVSEMVYKGTWQLFRYKKEDYEVTEYNSLTEEDLKKWDDAIKTFKKSMKKNRFRKPQEAR